MHMGYACIQSIYEAADAPTIRCVLLQLPKINATVSTNAVETVAILLEGPNVSRQQYYRRELSIPSRTLSMMVSVVLVDTNAWRDGAIWPQ